jgi:hypothetical protein
MVVPAGFDLNRLTVSESVSSKGRVSFSYKERLAGFCDSQATGTEFMKCLQNELAWELRPQNNDFAVDGFGLLPRAVHGLLENRAKVSPARR